MAHKNQVNMVAEAKQLLAVLHGLEGRLSYELTAANFNEIIQAIEDRTVDMKRARSDHARAAEARKQKLAELRELMKRLRYGTKAVFGDDSLEYERVGGKRRSTFKRRSRKAVSDSVSIPQPKDR